ncbi:MAG: hemin ABC transporter substrate-binding protein [Alcaligenaceae bacterium]|nr:MAG: hemin ABC transporter substrate-binding protein [Alcaligenaceae bacterium]
MISNHSQSPSLLSRRQALGYLAWCTTLSIVACPSIVRASPGKRVVCVGGALTELVFMLEAGTDLVGVDTTSIYPKNATTLPNVGYARQLSAEGVLSLRPSHVLATEEAGPPAVLKQIAAAGTRITLLPAKHQYVGLRQRVLGVGRVLERSESAQIILEQLDSIWDQVQRQIATQSRASSVRPVRVMFVLAHSPAQVLVAGASTAAQAMLDYAGAVNAVQGFKGYKPLTPESMIAAQPDCLLVTEQGLQAAGGLEAILKLPGLAQTPAGRSQAVVAMDALRLLGFGPRMPEAVLALHRAFQTK